MTEEKKRAKVVTRKFRLPNSQEESEHSRAMVASQALAQQIVGESPEGFTDDYPEESDGQLKPQLALVKSANHLLEWEAGLTKVGNPDELNRKLESVGYYAEPFVSSQVSLILTTQHESVRTLLLEGPSGAGKSFLAKCLAKITGAELMCLSCFRGINLQNLVEYPSTLGMAKAMTTKDGVTADQIMNLGIISRAFLASQDRPVILLVDELDKTDSAIDTFFLGPIQDGKVWLESREPIEANLDNLLIIFTKNFDRSLNDALLRRIQPLRMRYLDSSLERKVLEPHCDPKLIENLVRVADIMRYSDGSYPFERPPAPEELLKIGKYVSKLLDWGMLIFPL